MLLEWAVNSYDKFPPEIVLPYSACVWSETISNTLCSCLLYTSDAADERSSVDLGGRRIIKKKKKKKNNIIYPIFYTHM